MFADFLVGGVDRWRVELYRPYVRYRFLFLSLCVILPGAVELGGGGQLGRGGDSLEEGLSEVEEEKKQEKASGGKRPSGPPAFYSLTAEGHVFPESDIDGSSGTLAETGMGLELGWTRIAGINNFTRLTTSYSYRSYDVDQSEPYSGSFTEVNAVRIGGTFERPFADKWSGFVTSRLSLQSAKGTPLGDGWNVPFAAGIGYLFTPKLVVSVGVLGTWEAELGTRVIPLASFRWTPTDRLTIMTLNGVRVSYKLGEKKEWEVLSSVFYETFVFAVTDLEGFNREQGVVSQEYFQARVGLKRSFGPMFQVGAFVESRFNRKFEYYQNDDKFDEFRIDSSVGFRLTGTMRF
jgi:hypothetical protein